MVNKSVEVFGKGTSMDTFEKSRNITISILKSMWGPEAESNFISL